MEQEMKKLELSSRLFIAFLILIVGILGFFVALIVFKFKSIDYPREITVSAEGMVFAQPDIALVKLGVTAEGWEIKTVVKENTEKMNAILKEVKNLGVEEKDIQTTRYNLTPRYEWIEGKRVFKGYVLDQEVRVKIRNFEKIGQVMEMATEKGANLVGDLSFTIDDPELIREEAREEAIKRAKIKARAIAAQTGLKLKKVVNVYEDYNYPTPQPTIMTKDYSEVGGGFPAVPEIQPGEQEVVVRINLVYRLR